MTAHYPSSLDQGVANWKARGFIDYLPRYLLISVMQLPTFQPAELFRMASFGYRLTVCTSPVSNRSDHFGPSDITFSFLEASPRARLSCCLGMSAGCGPACSVALAVRCGIRVRLLIDRWRCALLRRRARFDFAGRYASVDPPAPFVSSALPPPMVAAVPRAVQPVRAVAPFLFCVGARTPT